MLKLEDFMLKLSEEIKFQLIDFLAKAQQVKVLRLRKNITFKD
jgi:hypothetical protein